MLSEVGCLSEPNILKSEELIAQWRISPEQLCFLANVSIDKLIPLNHRLYT